MYQNGVNIPTVTITGTSTETANAQNSQGGTGAPAARPAAKNTAWVKWAGLGVAALILAFVIYKVVKK